MLFLYRPPQTWMPYSLPRNRTDQAAYNRSLQARFDATRRSEIAAPAPSLPSRLRELADLHDEGALTDEEFTAGKAKLLAADGDAT